MAPVRYDIDDDDNDADDKYHESSDEDFNPDGAPAEDNSESSSEDELASWPAPRAKKRKSAAVEKLDSGDEATIGAVQRKKVNKGKKSAKGAQDEDGDALLLLSDEGGEGGLIKTRSQRRNEVQESRPLPPTGSATIDVDALWASMIADPLKPLYPSSTQPSQTTDIAKNAAHASLVDELAEDHVNVTKTYTFAGTDTIEEKSIPTSQLSSYLAQGWSHTPSTTTTTIATQRTTNAAVTITSTKPPTTAPSSIRRPLRRPSRYDPNPAGLVRALPPEHQLTWPRKLPLSTTTTTATMPPPSLPHTPHLSAPHKPTKLNVVTKSRLDWTGFVAQEGIGEDLDRHGRTKEAYLGRMEFLAGVERRREEDGRAGRRAAAAAVAGAEAGARAREGRSGG